MVEETTDLPLPENMFIIYKIINCIVFIHFFAYKKAQTRITMF